MGSCCSVSGRSTTSKYADDVSTASPRGSSHANRSGNTSQPESPLSGLSELNRSRSASRASLPPRSDASKQQFAVTKVLNDIRSQYYKPNLKSSNKMKGSGDIGSEMDRLQKAGAEIVRMRDQQITNSDFNVTDVIRDGKAHNCEELARLAAYLLEDTGFPARVVQFGAIHGVAAIGAGSGALPADMRNWEPHIYICDPWSNIACRATDYPDQFLAKMDKWHGQSKVISFDAARGFVSPMDSAWINTVLEGTKTAY